LSFQPGHACRIGSGNDSVIYLESFHLVNDRFSSLSKDLSMVLDPVFGINSCVTERDPNPLD
jgi:hypothetical protein